MTFLSKREWMFVAFILIYSFVPTFGGLLRIGELLGGVSFIPENSRAIAAPFPIVLHIVSSFCFCIFGAHQFLPSVRRLHSSRHRAAGKLVAGAGCVSALTGLWMTVSFPIPQELQGTLLFSARILLGVSMFVLIVWAVHSIRKGNVSKHSHAMLRAYAIGQGASTQTFLGIGWAIYIGAEPAGMTRDLLMVSAWALNLMAAEWLIARTSRQRIARMSGFTGNLRLPNPAEEK